MYRFFLKRLVATPGYIANYGYTDGSGSWYIIIDTDKCDGCGKCVEACPQNVFEVGEDEADPLRDEPIAKVRAEVRKSIKYICGPCKPVGGPRDAKCEVACDKGAISSSW
jgi:ferredoxin